MDIRPIIENIEYLKSVYGDCPAKEALDVLKVDALERIANALEKGQEEDSDRRTLTYHDFFKTFNKNGDYYRACKSNRGGVDIISTEDGELKASLLPHTNAWYFKESGFYDNDLILMAQLAATAPELRGEIDNERIS